MYVNTTQDPNKSLPSRERGLKLGLKITRANASQVAPFTGAWIEIVNGVENFGADGGRSLHGSVD